MNFHSEEEAGLVVKTKAMLALEELYPVHRLDKMTSG
ncbi:MAG: RNA pseudouridine synthase, partial [Thiovulaceae bacterium]|nr:RNA pseudouridine synthase [Sulfurimonadaceae bacterium]